MSTPIRVGVMGLGQRGLQHLKALRQLEREGLVSIDALVDRFPANLEADKLRDFVPDLEISKAQRLEKPSALIEERSVDALYVCIPPNVHDGEVVAAARAGIHLFVEKPMSLFLDEAREMEEAIRQSGIVSAIGFQQRYDKRHEVLADLLAGKRVVMACYTLHAPFEGHSIKHTFTETVGGPVNRVWTANRAWSGMTVVEAGIHLLDLWRYWFGDVEWVQAKYVHRPDEEIFDGADNPYAYSVQFGFVDGAVGAMNLSRLRKVYASHLDHQILWTEGRVQIERDGLSVYHYDGPYPPSERPEIAQVYEKVDLDSGDSTLEISRGFVQALRDGEPEQIRSSFSSSMNSLSAVLAANVSDELGGERVILSEFETQERYAPFRTK